MEWTTKMEGGGTLYLRDDGTYMYLEANLSGEKTGQFRVILQGLHGDQLLGTMSPREEGGLRLSRMIPRSTLGQWGCLPITKVLCQEIFTPSEPILGENLLFQMEEGDSLPKMEQAEEMASTEVATSTETLPEKEEDTLWEAVEREENTADFFQDKGDFEGNPEGNFEGNEAETPTVFVEVSRETESQLQPAIHPEYWMADKNLAKSLGKNEKVFEKMAGNSPDQGRILAIPYGKEKPFPMTSIFCFGRLQWLQGKAFVTFFFDGQGQPKFW